ncbi:MAG: RNA-binding S4 domain-containing protein [Schleiferilactobacillus perolens]|jgi:ribosomal 50S subunit-recycling heat shock protein|uniref:RNA-binding S4 domain-containing protein n=1 Tax=Schleiferilactobacillus perolens TaxID=100468 RepID=UPI0039EB4B3E|nr:RNA-binding S4 domain-containing protein [Schleiferilactobacillus harbinensis]MCI1913556.1 RNA-binding S4 domain-containing protein [Schleiferilactobacillus harbinensis]
MRLDKFLKVSRLVKRRSVAKEIADKGRILINGKPSKSASSVDIGDQLTLLFGNRTLVVTITDVRDTTKKDDAASLYKIDSDEKAKTDSPF